MKEVKSSNIHSVDHQDGTLTIKFHSGAEWDYSDVPAELHAKMMEAHDRGESIGKFFHANIRNQFKATKRESQND